MANLSKPNHNQALAGLSISLLIGGGVLIGDSLRPGDKPNRILESILGVISLSAGLRLSKHYDGDDLFHLCVNGVQSGIKLIEEIAEEITPREPSKKLITLALKAAPIKIRTWAQQQIEGGSEWFSIAAKGHTRLGGETGSGKTTLAEALIFEHLSKHPESSIAVCDINYGKRDKDWLGLSPDYIYPELGEIAAVIAHEYEELSRRRSQSISAKKNGGKPPIFSPRLLVVDELDSTSEDLGGKDSEPMRQIRAIAKQGFGYGFKLILIGQSFAVGETGISLATSKQFSNILVILDKFPKSELAYFSASNGDEIEEKIKLLKGQRRAIAQLAESSPSVVVIPDLSYLANVRLSHSDPIETWWKESLTEEIDAWAKSQAILFAKGEISSPLKEFAKKLRIQTLNSDKRYTVKLRPYWENLLSEEKRNNET